MLHFVDKKIGISIHGTYFLTHICTKYHIVTKTILIIDTTGPNSSNTFIKCQHIGRMHTKKEKTREPLSKNIASF